MAGTFHDWGTQAKLGEVRDVLGSWMESDEAPWEECALALFRWQAANNPTYGRFVRILGVNPLSVASVTDIPCMPVEVFKSHAVRSGGWEPQHAFRSSGTTSTVRRATHELDAQGMSWYRRVTELSWSAIWDRGIESHAWLGLLPGYVGREDASLLAMVSHFMRRAEGHDQGMLMHDHTELQAQIQAWTNSSSRRPLILFGVTWAILDWLEELKLRSEWLESVPWEEVTLVETGGMKGRDVEPLREEVHARIRAVLPAIRIASEYGMTEMLSQGYALDGEHHLFPGWVTPVVREARDPRATSQFGETGRLDVLDLANVHSCAFLSTGDAAQRTAHGLKLLGRSDQAEVRGCSLLAAP
jgi:hypothetical protein